MNKISRRNILKCFAAVPLAHGLRLPAQSASSRLKTSSAASTSWNLVLHGLYVIQWTSPAATSSNPDLMRIIFPAVDGKCHTHEYHIGKCKPANQGYKLIFGTTGLKPLPSKITNVRFDSSDVSIPSSPTALKSIAHCWLDVPRPTGIQPLRARNRQSCGIGFKGSLASKIATQLIPSVTLLQYSVDANSQLDTDLPNPQPTIGQNLVLRSEPAHRPQDNGVAAYEALIACLGVTSNKFDLDGDCCPPDPDPQDQNDYGVGATDESSLQEINGENCAHPVPPGPCLVAQGVQIRACMTVIAT